MASRLIAPAATCALLISAAACDKSAESVPYVEIRLPAAPRAIPTGQNAFMAYASLGDRAAQRAKLPIDARDTPGNRRKALAELGSLLPELADAAQRPNVFLFKPSRPFDSRPHQMGWLQLGRALVWRIEQAVDAGDMSAAARWTVAATTFGLDLGGGSISDATLGYGIVDGARRAIAPHVATLSTAALAELAQGLGQALRRAPDPLATIENESAQMLLAVKSMQDAHREGSIEKFAQSLYGKSRLAVRGFGKLQGNERNAFVRSLVEEAGRVVDQLRDRASAPGARRGPLEMILEGDERRIADQFFTTGLPWLAVRDVTVARTRLLYVTAFLHAAVAKTGFAPGSLSGIEPTLKADPYTGMELGYVQLDKDFIVYSYGLDGKDDRGDTDSEGLEPDLTLEGASR